MSSPDPRTVLAGLARVLSPLAGGRHVPPARRIYVNRNLRLAGIELVGFDMDHTLAIYNQPELERLSIALTLRKLVEDRGYPPEILELDYPPSWAIRGLVIDRPHGNVFKMDRHGHVGRVFHGRRALTYEERAALYRRERIRLSAPRYAWIDTLFALPEGVIFLRLVDHLPRRASYSQLWQDVRDCIDEAHRDDTLKSVIRADLGRYVFADPDLPAALHRLRSAGKRLFLLTNSLWDYTDVVMRHLLEGRLPDYPSWRHYFDVLIVGGAKPTFFTERRPFVELDAATGAPLGPPRGAFARGRVYQGGNLPDFERMSGSRGDRVLYVGDHIFGDILRAKKSSVWRTAMIVGELEEEIEVSERFATSVRRLDDLDRKRRDLEAEVDYQQLVLKELQRVAEAGEGVEGLDLEAARREGRKAVDGLRAEARGITDELERLEAELDRAYNPHWGPLFKERGESSRFGAQVQDYACLYTSRVSNFIFYSPLRYFRSPRERMPHDP